MVLAGGYSGRFEGRSPSEFAAHVQPFFFSRDRLREAINVFAERDEIQRASHPIRAVFIHLA